MTMVGAITRLTESGLSITRWEPVRGAMPPLNAAAWDEAFSLYKASPQYKAINQGMALDDFKKIYFWEWAHRLLGRVIGLVYAIPFFVFLVRGMIPTGFKRPLTFALLLGGLQGYVGWFMVQSGLSDGMVSVSPLRLAMHLSLALVIYGLLFWQILRLAPARPTVFLPPQQRWLGFVSLALLSMTIVWGAFTAGLDGGKVYNTWPLMGDHFLPSDALALSPLVSNAFANPVGAQFAHRWLAVLAAAFLLLFAWRMAKAQAKPLGTALAGFTLLQFLLGIFTLLSGAEITLATLHQGNMVLVLSALLACLYATRKSA